MFNLKSRWVHVFAFLLLLVLGIGLIIPLDSPAQSARINNSYQGPAPKYVFLFIGDGMSFPQVSSAEMYVGAQKHGTPPQIHALDFANFPATGVASTYDTDSFIPDSASTGTALASGIKTGNGIINMDAQKKKNYDPITRALKKQGYKIGIISSVSIDHATPAVFYANQSSRNNYYDIGLQLANSQFDYFAGGGFKDPQGSKSKVAQPENVLAAAKRNGFKVVNSKEQILALNKNSGRVIAINPQLDSDQAMPYEIDRQPGELRLGDYVRKGIEVLDNPQGYFMMVESGKIDWANHANDATASIQDTIEFNQAIMEAYQVYQKHPQETLIVVTGDHECGGMTIGFAGTEYQTFFNKLEKQTMSYIGFDKIVADYRKTHPGNQAKFEDLLPQIKAAFGLVASNDPAAARNKDLILNDWEMSRLKQAFQRSMADPAGRKLTEQENILYGSYEPLTVTLTHILNNKAGLSFTSYSHTGLPVPVYAVGAGQDLFIGSYDNTDINKKLCATTKTQ